MMNHQNKKSLPAAVVAMLLLAVVLGLVWHAQNHPSGETDALDTQETELSVSENTDMDAAFSGENASFSDSSGSAEESSENTSASEAAAGMNADNGSSGLGSYADPSVLEEHPAAPARTWLEGLEIPAYSGSPYAVINGNQPLFETGDLTPEPWEIYYELDALGRCTLADAVVGTETQPTEKRGNISSVKPTGWHTDRYSFVDGEALYNRCHLIAYYLSAENANPWNLVTGTRYMNQDGMNDFENLVGDYIRETGRHVRYRVTPVWTGENLLCDGLLVEGYSIEDAGDGICFCIFAYNVQPGVHIDYLTGDNYAENGEVSYSASSQNKKESTLTDPDIFGDYVLNKKSLKFHLPSCEGAASMAAKNREEYSGSRNALILDGYEPCPYCNP